VSGQPGVDPTTGEAIGASFGAQAQQAFRNLETVLRAGGIRLDLVASTTILVADVGDFAELNELYPESFPSGEAAVDQKPGRRALGLQRWRRPSHWPDSTHGG
jgi:enamine deaminase RidA (YjgF/YER057c/UK114 family)